MPRLRAAVRRSRLQPADAAGRLRPFADAEYAERREAAWLRALLDEPDCFG